MITPPRVGRFALDDLGIRISLLISQSLFLGVTLAILIIVANALFLPDYGPQALPYVYITVAITGALAFYGLTALQQRFSLPPLALSFLGIFALFYIYSWWAITVWSIRWISFALLVSLSLLIQMGFVFIGGQAGRLLDLRQIKRLFPRIVAGFVSGFMLGSLVTPILVDLLGGTANLLVAVIIGCLSMLVALLITTRKYRSSFQQIETAQKRTSSKSLPQLLKKRYVLLLFLYQMLAAMVNQFNDYILLAQAGARYSTSAELAQFFSVLGAVLNGINLLFLILIAGFLLSRYGLRAGLLSNPIVLLFLFTGMLVSGLALGTLSLGFFGFVVIARIANIVLTDGNTRGSINAAYQALPVTERIPVQTGAEGIGVPLALGIVGGLLLLANRLAISSIMPIVALNLVLILLWLLSGVLVFQNYARELLQRLRRQAFTHSELSVDDGTSQDLILDLMSSGEIYQVRSALDAQENADQPLLNEKLVTLTQSEIPAIRQEAFTRIEKYNLSSALPTVEHALVAEQDAAVLGAVVRAYCAIKESDALDRVGVFLDDPRQETCVGAMVGLLRYGGICGVLAAGEQMDQFLHSSNPVKRQLAAQVIGEVGDRNYYQPILDLLDDDQQDVQLSALHAAGHIRHPRLIPKIIAKLRIPHTRSAAVAALVAYEEAIIPVVQAALTGESDDSCEDVVRLVRICGQVKGERTIRLLKNHIQATDCEIRGQVLAALKFAEYQAPPEDHPILKQALKNEAEHSLKVLQISQELGKNQGTEAILRALGDELNLAQQRVFDLLTFIIDSRAVTRAQKQLENTNESERALALEMFEVSLPAWTKALVFPIIDPSIPRTRRIEQLRIHNTSQEKSHSQYLGDLIANNEDFCLRTWIQVCAIYCAGALKLGEHIDAIAQAAMAADTLVSETAHWAMEQMSSKSEPQSIGTN